MIREIKLFRELEKSMAHPVKEALSMARAEDESYPVSLHTDVEEVCDGCPNIRCTFPGSLEEPSEYVCRYKLEPEAVKLKIDGKIEELWFCYGS